MKKIRSIISLFILLSLPCFAQFSDDDLYASYLKQDMSYWGKYIRNADFSHADNAEKERILNYSYGYIAYAVSEKESDAEQLLEVYKNRLDEVKGEIAEAHRLTYLSAYYAYAINYNKLKFLTYGKETISLSEQAVENDNKCPLALSLRGNILFYCPRFFGGDKQKALDNFLLAEKQYKSRNDTKNWNYMALQLTIAQCYEKLGDKQEALRRSKEMLVMEPEFKYVRDVYLPKLEGKKVKNEADVTGKLTNMILE